MDYELLPGVVISVKDDEHLGRIKVAVPGGPTLSNTQMEALPWCYPMTMTGTYQGFTKLVDNCKVWVLRNKQDNLEMWYFLMADYNPNTEEIIAPYDNTEILISRDVGGNNVYIYYTDGQGIMLSVGGTKINITPKNQVILSTGKGNVTVDGENVFLNTSDNTHNAVRFDTLQEVLKSIGKALQAIQNACKNDTHTQAMIPDIVDPIAEANKKINDTGYRSDNVFTN